jgi:hypothetical protein
MADHSKTGHKCPVFKWFGPFCISTKTVPPDHSKTRTNWHPVFRWWLYLYLSVTIHFCMYLFLFVCIYFFLYVFIRFCMYLFIFVRIYSFLYALICFFLYIFEKTDNYEQMPIRVKFNKINEYLCIKMNKYSEKRINTGKNKYVHTKPNKYLQKRRNTGIFFG